MLPVCFVKCTMFIKNILTQAHKAGKMYTQIKHQRERERYPPHLHLYLMIKKSCHDSQTHPLRPWCIHSPGWHCAVSPSAHRKIFGVLYASHLQLPHVVFGLCSPVSGGFGGGFNGGGDGGKKGKKIVGDATANKPPAAKKPRTCGICHMPGHTRVTCPQRWQLVKDTAWSYWVIIIELSLWLQSVESDYIFQIYSNSDCKCLLTGVGSLLLVYKSWTKTLHPSRKVTF